VNAGAFSAKTGGEKTMIKGKSLLREIVCGLLLGLLIMPPQPAQAQWTVVDWIAYADRIDRKIARVQEWVDRISRWQQLFNNSVRQLSSLRGVLGIVDKRLSKDIEVAILTNKIADIIHKSNSLRGQVEGMVRYQISFMQQIDDRLKNGILDPEKDREDFENYLLYSLGRNSRQTIQLAVRTAQADAQVSVLMTKKQLLEIKLAEAYKQMKSYDEQLKIEMKKTQTSAEAGKTFLDLRSREELLNGSDDEQDDEQTDTPKPLDTRPQTIQALIQSIESTRSLINDLEANIANLNNYIEARIVNFGLKLSDMENFGFTIESTKAAWHGVTDAKVNITSALDAAVSGMQTGQ
jgi:hypothetical protein